MSDDSTEAWWEQEAYKEAESAEKEEAQAHSLHRPCSVVFDLETVEAALRRTEATACAMKEPDCSDVLAAEVRKLRRELNECREKNLWLVNDNLRLKRESANPPNAAMSDCAGGKIKS